MSTAFNPYREWLGLANDVAAPHFYQLLGATLFEADCAQLVVAADKALVRVRGFRPGPHAAAWAKVLDELSQAKACFQDPARKLAYDTQLRRQLHGASPGQHAGNTTLPIAAVNLSPDLYPPGMAPRAVAETGRTPASVQPASMPVSATRNPQPPGKATVLDGIPAAAAPTAKPRPQPPATAGNRSASEVPFHATSGDAAVHEPVPPGPVNAHVAPPRQPPQSLIPFAAAVAAGLVVLTLILLYVALSDGDSGAASPPRDTSPAPTTLTPGPDRTALDRSTVPPVSLAPNPTTQPIAGRPPSITNSPPAASKNAGPPLANAAPSTASADPNTTTTAPPDDNSPATSAPPESTGSTTPAPPVVSPSTDSEPPPATPSVSASPSDLAKLTDTLGQARLAIADRQFRVAIDLLEQSDALATTSDQRARVKRLKRLNQHAEQFWKVVASTMSELQAAEELTVGADADQRVIVVEAGRDSVTIHRNGRNEKYSLANMPPGLGLAIARRTLNESNPQTLLMFGACAATFKDLKPNHIAEAQRYWEQARTLGANVDDLLALLKEMPTP